jgi:hypothetical protein
MFENPGNDVPFKFKLPEEDKRPIQRKPVSTSGRVLPFNIAPVIIVGIGSLFIFVSLFMPHLSSDDLDTIVRNMVIENDPAVVLCALAGVISIVRYWNVGTKSSANLSIWAGIWFLGWCIYSGYTSELHRLNCDIEALCKVKTSPGAGMWASGLGSLVVALGGLMMRFPHSGFFLVTGPVIPKEERSMISQTKTCPRCAETIKSAAVVCRYCGHDFEPLKSLS